MVKHIVNISTADLIHNYVKTMMWIPQVKQIKNGQTHCSRCFLKQNLRSPNHLSCGWTWLKNIFIQEGITRCFPMVVSKIYYTYTYTIFCILVWTLLQISVCITSNFNILEVISLKCETNFETRIYFKTYFIDFMINFVNTIKL